MAANATTIQKSTTLNEQFKPVNAEFMLVTPEMAARWMEANTNNRTFRRGWANGLADSFRRGEYVLTHQGIAFSDTGRLLDGQHRLTAIIDTGIPLMMLVVTGIGDEAFKAIDCGNKRTVVDLTGLSKRCAEVARLATRMNFGNNNAPAILIEKVARSGFGAVSDRLDAHCSATKTFYSTAPVRLAAVALVLSGHSENYVFGLYQTLIEMDFASMPPVAHALCRNVQQRHANSGTVMDSFCKAVQTFSVEHRDDTKIKHSQSDINDTANWLRGIVKTHLGEK